MDANLNKLLLEKLETGHPRWTLAGDGRLRE